MGALADAAASTQLEAEGEDREEDEDQESADTSDAAIAQSCKKNSKFGLLWAISRFIPLTPRDFNSVSHNPYLFFFW